VQWWAKQHYYVRNQNKPHYYLRSATKLAKTSKSVVATLNKISIMRKDTAARKF